MWKTWVRSLGWEDPLEKGKATDSSILAWRISQGCQESDTPEQLALRKKEEGRLRALRGAQLRSTPQQRSNGSPSVGAASRKKHWSSWSGGLGPVHLSGLGLSFSELREKPHLGTGRNGTWCLPSASLESPVPTTAILQRLSVPGGSQRSFAFFWNTCL